MCPHCVSPTASKKKSQRTENLLNFDSVTALLNIVVVSASFNFVHVE